MNVNKLKSFVVRHLFACDAAGIAKALRTLGVAAGDTLMVHASWQARNGFRGSPAEFIRALQAVVTPRGVLLMPSLTYHNQSTREFLQQGGRMDVRRSPSKMGLLSEVFRRNREVRRSLSPTHPILAWGNEAPDVLRGHEAALVPFGPGTPFEQLLRRDGKILMVDAPFSTVTFTHFIEDRVAPYLPFPLYEEGLRQALLVDYDGNEQQLSVKVISEQANRLRREERLVSELERQHLLHRRRTGNLRLTLIEAQAFTDCVDKMYAEGRSFFDPPASR